MSRVTAGCMVLPLCAYLTLPAIGLAQMRDPRVDELTKETTQLKRTVADQQRRIEDLERIVKGLQGAATPKPAPIPAATPPWQVTSNWSLITKGMLGSQVIDILGPATREETAVDRRTLYYQPDSKSTSTVGGSVTLTDDRVTAMSPPHAAEETAAWRLASNWSQIKKGMSGADVVGILGPPTREETAVDRRTLYYQPDSGSTSKLSGSVTLIDDRVVATSPPAF